MDTIIKEIEALLVNDARVSFAGADLRQWLLPCVYLFLSKGSPLYVGYSKNGIYRAFQPNHQQTKTARAGCDEMRTWFCATQQHAIELEHLLITRLRPKYNVAGVRRYLRETLGNKTLPINTLAGLIIHSI